jgi:AmmeMemoRadiSam system protein B
MREMVSAGKFYDRDRDLLIKEITSHYEGHRGPGSLPLSKTAHSVKAVIAPTSPYKNSGDCSAWAYKEIAESALPDVYIIIAQDAAFDGTFLDTFLTPIDMVRVDQELAKHLIAKGHIQINDELHSRNYQIEVQLPFLQHAKMQQLEAIKILPLFVSPNTDVAKLASDLRESLLELKKIPLFICSANLVQYGPLFHYVPFASEVQDRIADLDKTIIDFIKAFDADGLRTAMTEQMVRADWLAIEFLLRVIKKCPVRVEQRYTSADILLEQKNSVSYAAIIFEGDSE